MGRAGGKGLGDRGDAWGGRPSMVSSVRVVGHLVDRDGDREDEAVVLARGGLDAVGVAQREPAL